MKFYYILKEVLSSLKQLKQSSATIGQSLKESLELQSSLQKERSTYNELAKFGSRLFFTIRELARMNPCYQFSVSAFMQIFLKNLDSKNVITNLFRPFCSTDTLTQILLVD